MPTSSLPRESFRVQRVLGQAQFGNVLLCARRTQDQAHDQQIVVKEVNLIELECRRKHAGRMLCDDPMRELQVGAKITAKGGHKNVVQYLDVLKIDAETVGIALEYCNEGDLLQRLEQMPDHRLSEQDALEALRQVVSGLQFLHEQVGIAHRDLSLENVLVHDGLCKISDFGLCTSARKMSRDCVGKLGYMAPEVVAGSIYDPKLADLWSLGIMFFVMLTGSPLVDIASADSTRYAAFCRLGVRRILQAWGIADELSPETIDLCEQLLQRDPQARISLAQVQRHAAFCMQS